MSDKQHQHNDDLVKQHEAGGHKHHSEEHKKHAAGHTHNSDMVKKMCMGGKAK